MTISLGAVQRRIMRVLWDEGEATARRITDVLSKGEPLAHSTVQTLLRQLVKKKAIAFERRDRTFVFRPLIDEAQASLSAAQSLLERVFHGSISGLVAQLLDSESVPPEELERLRALIETRAKEAR